MRFPFESVVTNEPDEIETHFASFAWLDKKENELLRQHFPLPVLDKYPQQIPNLLNIFCRICIRTLPPENIYYEQLQRKILIVLEKITANLSLDSNISAFKARSQLHQYLTHTPLYSALLLIYSCGKSKVEKYWWITMLARLYLHHDGLRYDDSLELDRTLRMSIDFELISSVLPQEDLEFLTTFELAIELKKLRCCHNGGFLFSSSFSRNIKLKKNALLNSKNIIESTIFNDDLHVKEKIHTDEDGNESISYLEFEPDRSLTLIQQRAIFSKRKLGMANAIRQQKLSLPLNLSALTAQKFEQFIRVVTPDLFSTIALTEKQISVRIIFWLEVWLGKPYSSFASIKVFNEQSKTTMANEVGFHYNANKISNNPNTLFYRLPTQLFKGKKAPVVDSFEKELYNNVSTESCVDVIVPYPLQTYFFRLVEKITINANRHNKPLQIMLSTTVIEYKGWLSKKIKIASSHEAQNITPSQLRNTFHYFSQSSLPKTDRAILHGSGVMGSFYVNSTPLRLIATLQNKWLDFLDHIDLNKAYLSVDESKKINIPTFRDGECTFGAALSLKETKLDTIISEFSIKFELFIKTFKNNNKMTDIAALTTIFAYIYFRTATTCALRPVKQPIPCFDYIAPSLGLMLTQDKDSHRNKELRVLIMDPQLSLIWHLTKGLKLQSAKAFQKYLSHNSNKKLDALLNDAGLSIDPSSFRHTAASLLVAMNAKQYQQHHFNVLMNHFEYGQSPLRPYSLISVGDLISEQQSMLAGNAALFTSADKFCIQILEKISNSKQATL